MKKIAISLLLLTSLCFTTKAQIVFEKTIHAQTSDSTIGAFCGVQCHDGGYMLAGYGVPGWYQWQMMLMKVDSLGNPLWKKFYGALPSSNNELYGIAQLPDSSFVCAGYGSFQVPEEGELAPSNSILMRVDKYGNLMWQREFDIGSYHEYIYNFAITDSSMIAVGVKSDYSRGPGIPMWIISDFNGENVSINTYDWGINSHLKSVTADNDGTFVLGGQATGYSFFLRTDSQGNIIDSTTIGEDYPEQFTHKDHISIGNKNFICGSQLINSSFYPNVYSLNIEFQLQDSLVMHDVIRNAESFKIVKGSQNSIAIAGVFETTDRNSELWLRNFDLSLNQKWAHTIGGFHTEYLRDLIPTHDGGYLLIGTSESFDEWPSIYLVKTDSLGQGNYTSPVIQYNKPALEISLYPNPASEYCQISLPENANVANIILYDISGKTVLNENVSNRTVKLNLRNLTPGIYLVTDDKAQFRTKLIIY